MLYIVGTPIGNLEDITYRQAKTLLESEIILAEDTRSTGMLLQKIHQIFDPILDPWLQNARPQLVSYYKEKEFQKLPEVLDWLQEGKKISLISEAGMPLVSDPGYLLVKSVIRDDIPYTVVPGPTAVTTAMIHSGFKQDSFMFLGFLPKKTGDVKKMLNKAKEIQAIMKDMIFVAYEAPHRIHETLECIEKIFPQENVVIGRELTKKFEEIIRGKATELKTLEFKGELTILIGPS